jgi:sucrose phosphorylase
MLITYADQVQEAGVPALQSLTEFAEAHLRGVVNAIHLLPIHPYSSDDGFSVIDYSVVEPALGDWGDVHRLAGGFKLMLDAVVNHLSVESAWFRGFLEDREPFRRYFVTVEGDPDLSAVVRPRVHPLLTTFRTAAGPKRVWTTFSDDQADLNFANPDVLVEILRVLLEYVGHGASFLRLDAIAYLWKEPGTSSIHLPQTHAVIQLLRLVLDEAAPQVALVTETNVAHAENLSYFGGGEGEAQLVYNFALPILALHAFQTGSAEYLAAWAKELRVPSNRVMLLNFLASHDGIGLNAGRGILPQSELDAVVARTTGRGGFVSERRNEDGTSSPYELNVNYFDALSAIDGGEPMALQVRKFLTAHALQLALAGMPAIYFHSLVGSRGWQEGVEMTGRYRSVNRQKLARVALEAELADPGSLRQMVFAHFTRLLGARTRSACFHPSAVQEVSQPSRGVISVRRSAVEGRESVLCLHNVGSDHERVPVDDAAFVDVIHGGEIHAQDGAIVLGPYETAWLGRVNG